MAATSVAAATTNTNQAHAAQTTAQDENNEQDTLVLNHKTRVYNKKGQKVYSYLKTKGLLQKAAQFSMRVRFKQ